MLTTKKPLKIEVWPNGLGCDVRRGRLWIEIWEHGGVSRVVADNTICGGSRTHWSQVERGTFEQMAEAAVESWKTTPGAWQECG